MVTKPAPAPQFKTLLGLKSAVWWFMAINRRMRNTGNLGALSSMHSVLTGAYLAHPSARNACTATQATLDATAMSKVLVKGGKFDTGTLRAKRRSLKARGMNRPQWCRSRWWRRLSRQCHVVNYTSVGVICGGSRLRRLIGLDSSSHRQLLTSTPFTVLLRSALPTFASVPTGKVTCFRVADLHGCNSGASPLLHDTAQSTIIVDFLPPAMQSVPDPVGITSDHPDQVSIIVVFPVAHGTGIGHSINRSADSEREDLRAREHLAFIKSSVLITWLTDSDPSMVAGGGFKINGAAHGYAKPVRKDAHHVALCSEMKEVEENEY
ncbi:uncharacterized protein CIMG_10669 [Coccidioides immitis RS]|uniref:Uncharacterized protein n=1 Tax=Coccidioides immitis (strain RS) TaxID=246410 RepID=A0A0D8JSX8_COCIM|nr:uncharacterized protein CIMG_10669 [Coccidioides immitis RS]KJF60219.1 hypothetical protein CIMG_10669 [Coccidioides immitis RS]